MQLATLVEKVVPVSFAVLSHMPRLLALELRLLNIVRIRLIEDLSAGGWPGYCFLTEMRARCEVLDHFGGVVRLLDHDLETSSYTA